MTALLSIYLIAFLSTPTFIPMLQTDKESLWARKISYWLFHANIHYLPKCSLVTYKSKTKIKTRSEFGIKTFGTLEY